jgi:putative ABC transport system permease protein
MHITQLVKTSWQGVTANKTRAVLTMLGIIIGITSIMVIMSLGQGASNLIQSEIQGIGTRTITVVPGREPRGPSDGAQTMSDSLKLRDIEALQKKENVPNLKRIVPVMFGGDTAEFRSETYRATIFGANQDLAALFDLETAEGRFLSEADVKSHGEVAVIGEKVRDELFGTENAIGERVKMKNRYFLVVGVLPTKGQSSFINFDDAVIIPYTTAQQYIFGVKYVHRLMIEADDEKNIDNVVMDIEATLRSLHGIDDPEKDDFFVQTQADLADRLGTITSVLTSFLTMVAAISLIVGGIGIMNIMLVSVTERTREIGLRKAVGATNVDIRNQFLLEAIMLTSLGGVIGITLGTTISWLLAIVLAQTVATSWEFIFPLNAVGLGIVMSMGVGLIFGYFPARNAAQKNPIESLRYE